MSAEGGYDPQNWCMRLNVCHTLTHSPRTPLPYGTFFARHSKYPRIA